LLSSIRYDIAFANVLARRARLTLQKCFSDVQKLHYTGRLLTSVFSSCDLLL
jgi:hypothetical protein